MKIKVYSGKHSADCTVSRNLTENYQKKPAIREIMEYAEPRMLSTLIVSGAKSPYDTLVGDTSAVKTKIGKIPDNQLIGDNAYRYPVMGRIQRKSIILSQSGTSSASGDFSLIMRDNLLYQGMVALFYTKLQARVQSGPIPVAGGFLYHFKTTDGTVFNYATHVTPQPGDKSCFGVYTAYGQRSDRGFSRNFYNDMYINHLTIQRKTTAISGSALSDVTWVEYNGAKGWFYTQESQNRLQFLMENEHHKWFSKSTMVDDDGTLLPQSRLLDEKGEEVVIGDGVIPQLEGGNELWGSGVDGEATIDDYKDMMTVLEKKSNSVYGKVWYVITGTDGYLNAQEKLREYHVTYMGGRMNGSQTNKVGGEDIVVGGNFDTFNWGGNQLIFCKHPFFDDEERFPMRGNDGRLVQSSMQVFLDAGMNQNRQSNIEILSKGAYGVNRSMVSAYIGGLTGQQGRMVQSSTDALEFNMLKEDGIFIYNTTSCGLLHKNV